MSVIQAIGQQNAKAEFAYRLQCFLNQNPQVGELFSGATSITTVVNLIAGMSFSEGDDRFELNIVDNELVFSVLFDSFYLLFIKELSHGELSQAEQLILRLSRHYAELVNQELEQAGNIDSTVDLSAKTAQANKVKCVLDAWLQLDNLYRQRREGTRNMGG
ncbi:MAG: hypothetical protein ACI90A_001237 [Shewanella sp.]|jgi:hypothetical protein